ncbi:histidine kinase [Tieghemostelium lacteum]|uniref:Histidine kinase n=1 Tax=Tieghemostelium lacteum TaxID=361077 RepID=A0A152A400_TIELA|nr:histidine kinase [Tieghemostelium lacteum]|eukprot:KYR00825.1 histidine kinase [Tieghemostelium lacteum]
MGYEIFEFQTSGNHHDDSSAVLSEVKDNWSLFYEFINSTGDSFFDNGIRIFNWKMCGCNTDEQSIKNKTITISHLCHSSETINSPIVSFNDMTGFTRFSDTYDDIAHHHNHQNNSSCSNINSNISRGSGLEKKSTEILLDSIKELNEQSLVLIDNRVLKVPLYRNCVIGELSIEPFTREEIKHVASSCLLSYITRRIAIQMKRYKYDRLLKLFVEYSCTDSINTEVFHRLTKHLCYYLNAKFSFVCSIEAGRGRTLSFCKDSEIMDNFQYDLVDTPCCELAKSEPVYFPKDLQILYPKDQWLIDNDVHSYMGIPLLGARGDVIGSLCVMSDKPFGSEALYSSILAAIANKTAVELERRKTIENYIITHELIDQSPTAIVLTSVEGMILKSCGAIQQLFGYTEIEISGKSIDYLQCLTVESTTPKLSELALKLDQKEIKRELVCLHKSKEKFPGEVCIRSIFDTLSKEPKFLGRMFVIRDIKETKQNQQQLLSMNQQLKMKNCELVEARDRALQAIAGKSQFIATISHEIRTPMNAVIGMTELLLSSNLNDEQLAIAEEIYKSSDLLLSITSDCLDFSKIEASKFELEIIDFDFIGCLESAIETLSISLINKPIEILLSLDKSVPRYLKGDPNKIRQVLLNMGYNSIKYTNEGHIYINIRSEKMVLHNGRVYYRIYCQIEDTGIGISEHQKIHLFQPFVQMDTSVSRKYGGTGLGLAICREISRLMSGDVSLVQSSPNQGSVFLFTAVLEESQISPVKGILESKIDNLDLSVVSKASILLIDDYVFGRNILIKKLYQEFSCTIKSYTSPEFCKLLKFNTNSISNSTILDNSNDSSSSDEEDSSANGMHHLPKVLLNSNGKPWDLVLIVERESYLQTTNFFTLSEQVKSCLEHTNSNVILCTNFKIQNSSTKQNRKFKFLILHKPLSTGQIGKILLNQTQDSLNNLGNNNNHQNSNVNVKSNENSNNSHKRKLDQDVQLNIDDSSVKKLKVNGNGSGASENGIIGDTIVVPSTTPDSGSSSDESETNQISNNRMKWNILLVEDNAVNRKVLSMQLKKLGFKCDSATDGSEAIEMFKVGKYDLIFMDLTMPIVDGPSATLQIRSYEEIKNISKKVIIVALTATVLEGSKKFCKSMGMNDFLMKPLKISELEKVLLYYLPDGDKIDEE